MTRILLAPAPPATQQRLAAATGGAFLALPPGELPAGPDALFARLGGAPLPDVLVLDAAAHGAEPVLALAAACDQTHPHLAVVVLTDDPATIGFAAMRAGVRDLVPPDADAGEIAGVLERAGRASQARIPDPAPAPAARGQILTVASPKGGAGKTTIATNLAVGLARSSGAPTVLVDLDLQFGDVASALELTPEYTVPDAVQGHALRDTMVLKTFLAQHRTGLYALCGADAPERADLVAPEHVTALLDQLASEFRFVVVDTGSGLTEHTVAAIEQAHDLVLVTGLDVPGVRGLRAELDTLSALGLVSARRHLVLNAADPRAGLAPADVEASLQLPIAAQVPASRAVLASVNQGVPLLESARRDPATAQLHKLVGRFTEVGPRPSVPAPRHARRDRNARRAAKAAAR